MYSIERYHDICCGHRVVGHEGKCKHLHGHNYRIHFIAEAESLDVIGRVLDFSELKAICNWVERSWDHKFLVWERDPILKELGELDPSGVVPVSFNPTAENIAKYLVTVIGPRIFRGVIIRTVKIEETRKCSASYTLPPGNIP